MVNTKRQKQPPEVFYIKVVLKTFAIFTREHLSWSLFLKVTSFEARNFIKKRLQHAVNIAKFLRTSI